jgi:hypothetical protein
MPFVLRKTLLRFNWLISPRRAIAARGQHPVRDHSRAMPEIEITDECRALMATEFPFELTVSRSRNGAWQMQIDAETWQRLQKVRRHGETISDCIIRVIIVTQHRRGLR